MVVSFRFGRVMFFCAALALLATSVHAQMSKVVALVKGEIHNQTGSPVADVQIQVYKGSEKVNNTKSTVEGKFQMILQPGTDYKLICTNSKYYYLEQMLSIPALEKYKEVPVSVAMRSLELNSPFPFSDLVFEPKSSTVSPKVTSELDMIAAQMKRNSKIALKVTVYPDMAASGKAATAQDELATARKNAISGYFLGKGLSSSNVTVATSTAFGPGKFERMVTMDEPAPAKGKKAPKKKKGKAPAPVKMKVPQTADVVMEVNG